MRINEINGHFAMDGHRLVCDPNTSGAIYLGSMLREWARPEMRAHFDVLVPFMPVSDSGLDDLRAAGNIRFWCPSHNPTPTIRYRAQLHWQQVGIPRLLRQVRPDLYFSPFHLTPLLPWGMPVVTAIHDVCFLSDPFLSVGHLVHRAQLLSAGWRARSLICVSEFTRAALSRWWPAAGRKAVAVPNGVCAPLMNVCEAERRLQSERVPVLPGRYFLWIGNPLQKRKNVELLLQAFVTHRQSNPGHRFVMVVPQSTQELLQMRSEVRLLGTSLVLLSGVSGELRDALYRCAAALVFPSTCEGFGYPVLEAMAQGCPPIAASDGPAGEIVGELAPLCPDFTVASFCGAMHQHTRLAGEERSSLAARLRQRAEMFSVERMARSTLDVLAGTLGQ